MDYRESIVINVSYGITYEDSTLTDQIERASLLSNGLLLLKRQLEEYEYDII
jgi:hypothetical protein